ncbi:MAG: hypothetical protein J6O40_02405 [Ruminococcus sp.]|nr:hypothetical protein [Ruminococcus sp.]
MKTEFEKLINELSPELQEKARACKTMEEFNEFIADNEIEIPEDALDMVAGGAGCNNTCIDGNPHQWKVIGRGQRTRLYECTVCHKRDNGSVF